MNLKQKILTSAVCSVAAIIALVVEQAPTLKTSEPGLAHIANKEGCRLNAYQCSAEKWTVGLGHTNAAKPDAQITHQQAADYFIDDIAQAETVVLNAISQTPTQAEFDMMVSFVFNLGEGNFQRSTLLRKFNAGQNIEACEEYLRWVYVNGQHCGEPSANCAGIITRRQTERDVCLNGY